MDVRNSSRRHREGGGPQWKVVLAGPGSPPLHCPLEILAFPQIFFQSARLISWPATCRAPRLRRGVSSSAARDPTRNQPNATSGRSGASTGHCADSLGVGRNVRPLRGCRVERAPGRDTKRRAVVCQDRHPSARAVGSLGEADEQSVMDFAMSDPALVLRRANPSGSWSETDYDVTVAAIGRVSAGILLLGRWSIADDTN